MTMYRDPRRAAAGVGIIASLMRAPTTPLVWPEENQFSEALCWTLRSVPGLARGFVSLVIAGDDEAEAALAACTHLGVETRVTGLMPDGAVVYPDISICGEDRRLQLLVEVKTHSTFHECRLGDGTTVPQPVYYARALDHEPATTRARVRRIGTLTIDPASAPNDAHRLRCADVSWRQVHDLLRDCDPPAGGAIVVDELREVIAQRLLRPRPTYESSAPLLAWANQVLPDVLTALAHAVGGSSTRQINQGTTEVYRGGFVAWTSPEGTAASMWAYVSPEGGGYSVAGAPDALYLQPDQGGAARKAPMLGHRLGHGFVWDRDLAGWENWRVWMAATEVRAAGDIAAQVALVASRFTDALAAGHLLRARSVV